MLEFDDPQSYSLEEDEKRVENEEIHVTPSSFTEHAIKIPSAGKLCSFDFSSRRYLKTIYDTNAKRVLLKCGRQVEKSTFLGNKILAYSALIPFFRTIYVSPSNQQTKVFSRDRIKDPMEASEILKAFTNPRLLSNVLEKKFVNGSQITLRFAFLNADRVRGNPGDFINIDEIQDVLLDNIPVIEECASHSTYKLFSYSGTPKSLDGALEYYWARLSTQNEWVVPCRGHGTPNNPGSWHWNILTEDNIGKEGLICSKCGKLINAADDDAQWASLNPTPNVEQPFEGYRIPQLMVPWIEWPDILHKQRVYGRARFHNEVLGLSYDSGTRPLTRQDLIDSCSPKLSMRRFREVKDRYSGGTPIFMGVDWGSSENSYTVVSLAAYLPIFPDRFTYFYMKRFEGPESEPKFQIEFISKMIEEFNIMFVGVDYGGGHWPNDMLIRKFGTERIKIYQWVGRVKKKVAYQSGLGVPRYLCHRTEIMSDFFNGIKRRDAFVFPRWEEFQDPYGSDFLNIFSEFSDRLHMNVYKHAPGCPDDSAHSCIYNFMGSMHYRPRPDIILPKKDGTLIEDENEDELDIV